MIDLLNWIKGSAPAEALRLSRWVYPLVNAGHILGIALLVGAVAAMDVAVLRGRDARWLRPQAIAGLALAAICGALLFAAQATNYAANGWFRAKLVLIAAALVNAVLHVAGTLRRPTAVLSLALWPAALVCGRMVAYS